MTEDRGPTCECGHEKARHYFGDRTMDTPCMEADKCWRYRPMTEDRAPTTEAGRALVRLMAEWAIRGNGESLRIEREQGWSETGRYQTNTELARRIALAIEREARDD